MVSVPTGAWRSRVWLLSAAFAAIAGLLTLRSALSDRYEDALLSVAILAALQLRQKTPLPTTAPGFSIWAALVVALGLCLNAAVLWGLIRRLGACCRGRR